ncbi:MAG: pentapeptide repeat-containing protein [Candidatus Binatia bacterium]
MHGIFDRRWLQRIATWFQESPSGKAAVAIAEVLGKLAIIYTIISYLMEAPERQKTKEFQAWQVINTAREGDGGRKLALHDLISDNVDLSGIGMNGVVLSGTDLRGAKLDGATISGDLNGIDFRGAKLGGAMISGDLNGIDLRGAMLGGAIIRGREWITPKLGCEPSGWQDIFNDILRRINPISALSHTCRRTDLTRANIEFQTFASIDFSSLFSDGPILDATTFSLISEEGDHVYLARFDKCKFDNSELNYTRFDKVNFFESSFIGTHFNNVQLEHVAFGKANFEKAPFVHSTIKDWLNSAHYPIVADSTDGGFEEDDEPDFANAKFDEVTVDGHPITEADFKWGLLCHTSIEGLISDRDCKKWETSRKYRP